MQSLTRYTALVTLLTLTLTALSGSATLQSASNQQQTPKHKLLIDPVSDPHQPGVQWFAPTGHTLRGAFLNYWTKYGGLAQFGYPITEEFVESAGATGKEPLVVQYFERNRFEYHPENSGMPYDVLLGSLGLDFHDSDPPVAPITSPGNIFFGPTGHNVYGPFLTYWQTHGGLLVHGYPVTEAYYEKANPTDGKSYLVQYFERSRFELHPENAGSQYEVLLGLLGTQLSQKKGYPYGWHPIYGHASDFSWVSGPFFMDPRACVGCSCDTISYVKGGYFKLGTSVHPYGPAWDAAARGRQIYGNVTVFGRFDDTGVDRDSVGCPLQVPGYFVELFQTNPAQQQHTPEPMFPPPIPTTSPD